MPMTPVDSLDVVGQDGVPHTVAPDGRDHPGRPRDHASGGSGPDPNRSSSPSTSRTSGASTPGHSSSSPTPVPRSAPASAGPRRGRRRLGSFAGAEHDYQSVVATRTAAWTVMAISVGVALLAYGLATVDRAREQRRPRARLVALGVPAALLRRVEGVQNLIPLLTTVVLAAGLGLVATWALAHTDDQPVTFDPGLLATLLGLVTVGAVLSRAPPSPSRVGGSGRATSATTDGGQPTTAGRRRLVVVATFSSVSRQNVLQAIAEYDSRGSTGFLDVYGFDPLPGYALVHEGRSYDLRAVVGVAHRFATGRLATSEEFGSSTDGAVAILRKRGFDVTEPAVAVRAGAGACRARAAGSADTRRAGTAVREAPSATCPTCFMTLPATGICDECG